ncbi:MAG: restriction endonuclease, partial [Candidatus Hydrogenedentes bacterium]|nr:restriction endonuclease [Candidatus Hydrogenedentota bacterium]
MELLKAEARAFADRESRHGEPSLYGVTDGKAIGTYLEHKFRDDLAKKYKYKKGSSAKGIDFPELNVDVKVTSAKQPQSSCPFTAARQKIYGLGYDLLVFVYRKTDDARKRSATLSVKHVIYVEKDRTGDFQTTKGILQYIANGANEEDLIAFMTERMLPLEE